MRYMSDGSAKVKIGGRIRGVVFTKSNRATAMRAADPHYDQALLQALRAGGWKVYRAWMGASVKSLFRKYRGRALPWGDRMWPILPSGNA